MRINGKQFSKPTYLIDTPGDVGAAVEDIARSRRIGVDTEGNSLHAFAEQVCMVQVSNTRANYIFDPIRLDDLSQLAQVFSNPRVEKIFHGADYDVGLLKRDFGFVFKTLFDTMLAAQYLNKEKIGMADLVEECYEIKLEKKYTKCDWASRPLSIDKIVYLCQDTQYLIGLREWLYKQLAEKNLLDEAKTDFAHLETRTPIEPSYKNQTMWDIKGVKGLDIDKIPAAYELYKWRKHQAKRRNVPPFKVMNNKTIITIANEQPGNKAELLDIKGITPNVWRRYGKFLLRAVAKGKSRKAGWTPPKPKEKMNGRRSIHWNDQELADALKKWRHDRAEKLEIHPLAVLPGHTLIEISRKKPRTVQELQQIEWLGGARIRKYADEIIEVVKEHL